MVYGSLIGVKFNPDGLAKAYPGNTVVSDLIAGGRARVVLSRERDGLSRFGEYIAFLPSESYHMTVIRGMNGLVRKPGFWPPKLDLNCSMAEADVFLEGALSGVKAPENPRMRFGEAVFTREDLRVKLKPADEACERELKRYRDEAADAVGLRLPGHDGYVYHITLGYTLALPEGEAEKALNEALGEINARLALEYEFSVSAPHAAFYNDMLYFSPVRMERV